MDIQSMFEQLPPEEQQQCYDTLEAMQRMEDCRPDEWKYIVQYYYDLCFNSVPNGWFCWWKY